MARPIEQLEPRRLFAASITPVQVIDGLRTVTLEGDFFSGAADTFTISHDGNDEDLTFSGTISATRNNVERLRVRGHGGGDAITYTLTSTLLHDFVLDVETGDGNDTFTANLNADTNTDPDDFEFVDLDIEVRGGGGNDNLRVNADRDNNPFGFRVRFPTFVTVGLRGESGRDALRFDYGGDLLGGIFARLIGGDDDDGVTINANLEDGSDGTFFARAEGNFGSDTLALLVTDNSGDGDAAVDALIDGGVGASIFFPVGGDTDRGTRTANVRSQFLESDSVITSPQFPQRSVTHKARGRSGHPARPDRGARPGRHVLPRRRLGRRHPRADVHLPARRLR